MEYSDDSDSRASVNTDEQAEDFYRQLLEAEHLRECGLTNHEIFTSAKRPSYLAMVKAKIQSHIFNQPCTMLIDTGSELNIMTSEQAYALQLPVDPTGALWSLRGISGHQVALEGLCRNVPVTLGGVEVPHNFFISKEGLNGKDMILGQPWLYGHSSRIEYMPDVGMTIQIWTEGDRDNGTSVRIKLPIMNAQRNVFPISAHRRAEAAPVILDVNTVEPGAMKGEKEIPQFLSRITSALIAPEPRFKKLRPDGLEYALISREMKDPTILKAIRDSWFISKSPNEVSVSDRIEAIGLAKGL